MAVTAVLADDVPAVPSNDLQNIYLAAELAAIGRERKDPVLLIAAARLLDGIASTPLQTSVEVKGGEPDTAAPPPQHELTADALRSEAVNLANGDSTIIALAQPPVGGWGGDAPAAETAGGPKSHRQLLARGARATFRADYRGGRPAEAVIVGSQTANLDLVVLNEKKKVVCESRGPTDYERCRWTPPKNGQYFLVVENRGSWTNLFSIYTN